MVEKMMGMKDILTPDEKRILNILETSCYGMETIEEKKENLIYVTAFTMAMKIVKNNLEVLPGEEFICRLNSLIDKIEKSMSTKN
jgi:hypothetical protein